MEGGTTCTTTPTFASLAAQTLTCAESLGCETRPLLIVTHRPSRPHRTTSNKAFTLVWNRGVKGQSLSWSRLQSTHSLVPRPSTPNAVVQKAGRVHASSIAWFPDSPRGEPGNEATFSQFRSLSGDPTPYIAPSIMSRCELCAERLCQLSRALIF